MITAGEFNDNDTNNLDHGYDPASSDEDGRQFTAKAFNGGGGTAPRRSHRNKIQKQQQQHNRHTRHSSSKNRSSRVVGMSRDGLTTATSISSSTPSPASSVSGGGGEGEGGEDEDEMTKETNNKVSGLDCVRTQFDRSLPNLCLLLFCVQAFRYADAKDIAGASLRKSCLQPQKATNAASTTMSPPPVRFNPSLHHEDDEDAAAVGLVRHNNIHFPYATLGGRGRGAGGGGGGKDKNARLAEEVNYFDPLMHCNGEEGQIILLPPSDSIPDILQGSSPSPHKGGHNHAGGGRGGGSHHQSLTRSGKIPRDVMALYNAKVCSSSSRDNNGSDIAAGKCVIVKNDLSVGGGESKNGSGGGDKRNNGGKAADFNSTIDRPIPEVPDESYISAASSNIDQNV